MTTTITWNISQLDTKPQDGSYTNVVITAHWQCVGVDGNYKARIYNSCSFAAPGNPFIAYEDLTSSQVLDWIWASGVNKDNIESAVQRQIDYQKNPPVVSLPLPWAST